MAAGLQCNRTYNATSSGDALAFTATTSGAIPFLAKSVLVINSTSSTGTAGTVYIDFTTTSGAAVTAHPLLSGASISITEPRPGGGYVGLSWITSGGINSTVYVLGKR